MKIHVRVFFISFVLIILSGCLSQEKEQSEAKISYQTENKGTRYIEKIEAAVVKLILTEREPMSCTQSFETCLTVTTRLALPRCV